jgi:hypothetical protein
MQPQQRQEFFLKAKFLVALLLGRDVPLTQGCALLLG